MISHQLVHVYFKLNCVVFFIDSIKAESNILTDCCSLLIMWLLGQT